MGIIYLVQPEELVGTNRWKIGCSKRPDLKRVTHGYKKGTRHLCIVECEEPHSVERQLVKFLDKKYKKFGTSEYYEAFEDEIRLSFMNFVLKEYKKEKEVIGAFEDDFKEDDWDDECEYDWKEDEYDSGDDWEGDENDDLSSLSSSEFSDDDDKKKRKAKPQQKEKKKTVKTTKTTKTQQQNLQVSVEVNVNNSIDTGNNNESIKKKRTRMKKTSNNDQ